jgi:hypothetical protein
VALALALTLNQGLRADEAADARATIGKALKAAGGEDKLAKMPAATWSEKGMYYGMGEGLAYTGKYAVQYPDKFRMEIEGFFTIVLDGDKGWMNGEELDKDRLAEQKAGHYSNWVTSLLPLKDKEFKLSPLPEAKVDNKPVVGVKVSRAGHRDINLFFDKDTGLLVKSSTKAKAEEQGGQEVTQDTLFMNYKDVDGIKTPMKFAIMRDGNRYIEAEIVDYKRADKLDPKTFAK